MKFYDVTSWSYVNLDDPVAIITKPGPHYVLTESTISGVIGMSDSPSSDPPVILP